MKFMIIIMVNIIIIITIWWMSVPSKIELQIFKPARTLKQVNFILFQGS